ncbi:hypothetical protein Ssi03_58510 [Sphaerisporangium siamense]|nr:hypothetical protein Ssi03_58510 [Sphaerisporangium siamense]
MDPGCLSRAADALDRFPRLAVLTARILVEPDVLGNGGRRRRTSSRVSPSWRGRGAVRPPTAT